MRYLTIAALLAIVVVASGQSVNEEPAIRPDPRPRDLTSKDGRGSSNEPRVRPDPRPLDLSGPRNLGARKYPDVFGLSFEQTEKLRVIRQRAADDIQVIRDRERAEIMSVLNEQQRAEFIRMEEAEAKLDRARRPTTLPAPTTAEATR